PVPARPDPGVPAIGRERNPAELPRRNAVRLAGVRRDGDRGWLLDRTGDRALALDLADRPLHQAVLGGTITCNVCYLHSSWPAPACSGRHWWLRRTVRTRRKVFSVWRRLPSITCSSPPTPSSRARASLLPARQPSSIPGPRPWAIPAPVTSTSPPRARSC